MPCRANSLRLAKTRQGSPELAYSGQQSAGVALLRSRLHQSCPTLVNASPELPRRFHQSSELWRTTDTRKCVQIRVGVDTTGLVCAILPPVQSGIWAKGMRTKPRRVLRWSCKTAGEAFGLIPNRLVVALAKSQDHRSILRGFAFGTGRQGALANGADISRTQERRRCGKPNRSEPALIERPAQAWLNVTHRSSHPEESIRQAHLVWEGQKNPPDGAGRKSPVTRWRYA